MAAGCGERIPPFGHDRGHIMLVGVACAAVVARSQYGISANKHTDERGPGDQSRLDRGAARHAFNREVKPDAFPSTKKRYRTRHGL